MWIKKQITATLIGDGLWRLECDVVYQHKLFLYTVKKGFETDFASIPSAYRWRFNPANKDWAAAAVIHDALYAGEMVKRELADQIFRDGMKELGAGWWKRNVMHKAVRMGGGFTYNAHTEESISKARDFITIE